jgi:hypothetical protein
MNLTKSGVEAAAMEAAKRAAVEPTTAVEASASATMEPAAVGASTSAMRVSVGEIWLAERGKTQQGGCSGTQGFSNSGSVPTFA